MHTLTLSSLALALGTLTINAEKTSTAGKPNFKSEKPLPVYNWEHRTICMQDILNPQRKDKEEYLKYDVQIVGYAWDETNGLTPDHKWNWNTTKNARVKIWQNIPMAGDISDFKFMSGERDNRGFTQFTVELEMTKFMGPIEQGLNEALGFEGMEYTMNPYESVVCLDRESEGPRKPNPEEAPYEQVEDEIQLEKQRFEQLHKDRAAAAKKALTESDQRIQENAGKVPKKTPEMEESDRRIQSIPQVIQGLPPRKGGNFTGGNFTD